MTNQGSIRVLVHGAGGRMGKEVVKATLDGMRGCTLAAAVDSMGLEPAAYPVYTSLCDCADEVDCIIDFSHHSATEALTRYAAERKIPVVVATTGHTPEESAMIDELGKTVPVFRAANMSVGVALLIELAKETVRMFPDADIEIVESHHNQKLDVPSGTALAIANGICSVREGSELVVGRHTDGKRKTSEIGIHSLRLGSVVGIHEVVVHTGTQVITLKHEAISRSLFAEGAVAAAAWLVGQGAGIYGMADMLG